MTETAVYLQPAFILQQHKYRETSLIIDALTRDFGRISLLAKGVRKAKSTSAGLLQPFVPLSLSYLGKAELKTLTAVERRACGTHAMPGDMIHPFSGLQGMALYCGFYINELVACFLHKYDPHPEVFDNYQACLFSLAEGSSTEAALRLFELKLMENTGYALQLECDNHEQAIEPLKKYHVEAGQWPLAAEDGLFSGKTLQALNAKELTDAQVLSEAKMLMRKIIDVHLQGKPLKSRAVIRNIMAATPTITHHQTN